MIYNNSIGLRAVEEIDLEQLREWRNKPELRKFFREVNEINKIQQKKWFNLIMEQQSKYKMFSIIEKKTDKLLGACGLCYIDWVNRSADFSIYIGHEDLYINTNYAIDAAIAMRDYAFNVLNLHRLWAEVYDIDEDKKKFFLSLGFDLEAVHKETYWYNNQWNNSLYFSYIKNNNEK